MEGGFYRGPEPRKGALRGWNERKDGVRGFSRSETIFGALTHHLTKTWVTLRMGERTGPDANV